MLSEEEAAASGVDQVETQIGKDVGAPAADDLNVDGEEGEGGDSLDESFEMVPADVPEEENGAGKGTGEKRRATKKGTTLGCG